MVTVGDYISNPYGKGASVASTSHLRENTIKELNNDYPSPITYTIYGTKKNDIIIHCKMPSRTKRVTFDVVFQINISMANDKTRQTIKQFPFRCFSNSPSFYYTYAKAFKDEDMICEWLWNKYDRKVRKVDSTTRNPHKIVGYERTVYTCLFKVYNDLSNKNVRDIYKDAIAKSTSDIAKLVTPQDKMEEEYNKANYTDLYLHKKNSSGKQRNAIEGERKRANDAKRNAKVSSGTTAKVGTTKTTSKTSRTKKTSTTAKIK